MAETRKAPAPRGARDVDATSLPFLGGPPRGTAAAESSADVRRRTARGLGLRSGPSAAGVANRGPDQRQFNWVANRTELTCRAVTRPA